MSCWLIRKEKELLLNEYTFSQRNFNVLQDNKNKELAFLRNEVKSLKNRLETKTSEDCLLRDEFNRNTTNLSKARKENLELKTRITELEEQNTKNETELDFLKKLEKSLKSSSKQEIESLLKENEGFREKERTLLVEKNKLEIELQNMKVENEKLWMKGCGKGCGEFVSEDFNKRESDTRHSQVMPVRDISFSRGEEERNKGLEKLGELDKIIQDFKQRRLKTFK